MKLLPPPPKGRSATVPQILDDDTIRMLSFARASLEIIWDMVKPSIDHGADDQGEAVIVESTPHSGRRMMEDRG